MQDEILADDKKSEPRLLLSENEPFAKRNKWTAIALTYLAPYMETRAIEKYFAQLNQLVNYLLNYKTSLKKQRSYKKFLHIFTLAIINLLFFISAKTRETYLISLPSEVKILLSQLPGYKERDKLTATTLDKINEQEELLHLHPYYLNHFVHNGGFNLDFVYTMRVTRERKILVKLFEKNIHFDPCYIA